MQKAHRNKSIVFVCPDYHCSFLYREELRKRGWKADIYVPPNYPRELLYGDADIISRDVRLESSPSVLKCQISICISFFKCLYRYKYHFYYGRLDYFKLLREPRLLPFWYNTNGFRLHLFLTSLFRRKVIYVPSGTPDEVSIDTLELLGNRDEGVRTEDFRTNLDHLNTVRRYSHVNIGVGFNHTDEFQQIHFQYKCLDLERWRPGIAIPDEFLIQRKNPDTIWILHSFMFSKERQQVQGGNIKGTQYVLDAVKQLKEEGFNVDLMMFDKVPINNYIYFQLQADVVVEELIRGCWGSTTVECLALGKPVLTYIRKEWEQNYLKTFPWIEELPVLSTDKYSIYENLKKVVASKSLRDQMSIQARNFALENFDVKKNVHSLVNVITSGSSALQNRPLS